MNYRSRKFVLGGALLGAVFVIGAAYALARRGSSTASRPSGADSTPAGENMKGMAGMEGMSMSSDGSAHLTADQIRQFGVTFGTAEVRPLTMEIRTTGVVTFDETRIAKVTPKFGGFVERLHVETTGQLIGRGQPLAEIYSPELVSAQQDLLVAINLDRTIGQSVVPGVPASSMNLLAAAKRRLQLWDISDAQIQRVMRTGRVQRTLTLYSPAKGIVVEKKVVQGQAITPGMDLYTIADLSEVWVDLQLRGGDAATVRTGSGADIVLSGIPGRSYKGRVAYVYPTLDSASRAIRARVVVSNSDGIIKPGMYATARITTPTRSVLTVPGSAVLRTGERDVVFVDMGGGRLMPHVVRVGQTAGEYIEILGGVDAGQRVVTSAQFLLDSEANLGEIMKSMIGMGSSGGTRGMENMPGMSKQTEPMSDMNDKGADVRGMKDMPGMKMPGSAPTQR
ncbi:MAG: efflux RND transporter periplasmic adaptor subunit [Gemmatimonadaceae bacterium]